MWGYSILEPLNDSGWMDVEAKGKD